MVESVLAPSPSAQVYPIVSFARPACHRVSLTLVQATPEWQFCTKLYAHYWVISWRTHHCSCLGLLAVGERGSCFQLLGCHWVYPLLFVFPTMPRPTKNSSSSPDNPKLPQNRPKPSSAPSMEVNDSCAENVDVNLLSEEGKLLYTVLSKKAGIFYCWNWTQKRTVNEEWKWKQEFKGRGVETWRASWRAGIPNRSGNLILSGTGLHAGSESLAKNFVDLLKDRVKYELSSHNILSVYRVGPGNFSQSPDKRNLMIKLRDLGLPRDIVYSLTRTLTYLPFPSSLTRTLTHLPFPSSLTRTLTHLPFHSSLTRTLTHLPFPSSPTRTLTHLPFPSSLTRTLTHLPFPSSLTRTLTHLPFPSSLTRTLTHLPFPSSLTRTLTHLPFPTSLTRTLTHLPFPSSLTRTLTHLPFPSSLTRTLTHLPFPSSHSYTYPPTFRTLTHLPSSLTRTLTHLPFPSSLTRTLTHLPFPSSLTRTLTHLPLPSLQLHTELEWHIKDSRHLRGAVALLKASPVKW